MKKLFIISVLILAAGVSGVFAQGKQMAQVLQVSTEVVATLKARDMNKLSRFVHPSKGVRFSPYGYIQEDDLVFKAAALKYLLKSRKVYRWGMYDESDESIKMTFANYYKNFVYDRDFAKPDIVNFNLKKNNGIMINNIGEFYPKGVEVEYLFEGTDEHMYASLRLVYERQGSKWFLVGIVRDTPGI